MKNYLDYKKLFAAIFILVSLNGCDGGLEPNKDGVDLTKAYIEGYVKFKDSKETWPSADSIKEIRVVAFKNYPPGDIMTEFFSGNVIFSDTLAVFVDSSYYELVIDKPPVEFKYIVAAQKYNDSITSWRAIGVYFLGGGPENPASISVEQGKTYTANINVDFQNLPPQPF